MRTIKFRGKVISDTEAHSYWMFVTPDSGSWEQFWSITRKETRGQFTGLLDKIGREIYEGDIVQGIQHPYNQDIMEIEVVEYDEEGQLMPLHAITGYDGELWMHTAKGGYEVIGNIYENPELVEKS